MTEIFVFGSNKAGRHGKGAALCARQQYGAQYGVGRGLTNRAYAVPTKDEQLKTLPLAEIEAYVREFLAFARSRPDLKFKVTAIGTGLAGYSHRQIAPMFDGAPANCALPAEWEMYGLQRCPDCGAQKRGCPLCVDASLI